jgi:hypothetical protein
LKRDLDDDEEEEEQQQQLAVHQQLLSDRLASSSLSAKRSRVDVPNTTTAAVVSALKNAATFNDFSDSDEDFSLADVGGGDVVQSMLDRDDDDDDDDDGEQDDDDDDDDEESDEDDNDEVEEGDFDDAGRRQVAVRKLARTETPGGGSDNDSVQNAINSILDLQERGDVQTPEDLNNLTGLLDSMEEEEGEDPTLDAAVKSIL